MDPRLHGPQVRDAKLSPLMVARSKASMGERVNFCPFGCKDEQLDDNGYCVHLVGFTTDGKVMEPMGMDAQGKRKVFGSKSQEVLPDDKLVRITVSSRVYRQDKSKAKV